jgi:putative phage-type endonuclease
MKIATLVQGSAAWHAHRAEHFNASDAPAMLGVSPYKTRSQLLREIATGVAAEIDEATQRRFDEGHRFEELARQHAERIIDEELYPCVGSEGKYSASFDGITLMCDTAFEHKTLNDELRAAIRPENSINALPEHYRVQMEQQCMVSGAQRVLFMASAWQGDELIEERHCWYYPDLDLRARIVAGWEQFARDLEEYVPQAMPTPAVARPVEGFGALALRVEGRVLASNLDNFRAGAEAFLARLPRPADLQTDQDFADAESAVKTCAEAERRIESATDAAIAQMADVDAVLRAATEIRESIRAARLALDKAVKAEKETRKASIVARGVTAVREHYAAINATLGEHAIGIPATLQHDIAASIKGLRTLASITDAVGTAAMSAKLDASQRADRIRAARDALAEASAGHETLFPDRVSICANKSPEDVRNLAAARIAEHKAREEARRAAEAERAAKAAAAATLVNPHTDEPRDLRDVESDPAAVLATTPGEPLKAAAISSARIKLGDINARIAPLSITAEGLASLGFRAVGTERAAKLYDASQFTAICDKLIATLAHAKLGAKAAA